MTGLRTGRTIDNKCAVFIEYEQDDRGVFRIATLGTDDWGDRAVVVESNVCEWDTDCHVLTVAPDESDTVEEVHANANTEYAVADGAES